MLLRQNGSQGVVLITQPAHAWISGQLARLWGGGAFPLLPEPVCMAAEMHDIGFLDWDQRPSINHKTGLPYSFLEMPSKVHLELWTKGVQNVLRFGRYPALLVSLHFTNIARQQWISEAKKSLADEYLAEQEELQRTLRTSLLNDVHYTALATDEAVLANQQIVSILDWLSLMLCLGASEETNMPRVPTSEGCMPIKLTPLPGREFFSYSLAPWPFRTDEVTLTCEGRHLLKPCQNEAELHQAMRSAAPMTLQFMLRPAQ